MLRYKRVKYKFEETRETKEGEKAVQIYIHASKERSKENMSTDASGYQIWGYTEVIIALDGGCKSGQTFTCGRQ